MGANANTAPTDLRNFTGNLDPQAEADWLKSHGMLHDTDAPYEVVTNEGWAMPGSEAYIIKFSIHERSQPAVPYVMKACIVAPASATMEDWVARRRLLESHGVSVPRLHDFSRGTLIEESIPYELREAYTSASSATREALRTRFTATYRTLLGNSFRPISLHDVRSRGDDVVLIDFGSDLGGVNPAYTTPDSSLIDKQASEELGRILGKALLA